MARLGQPALIWAVTLASVALSLAAPATAERILDVAAVAAILLLGVPHGALDLLDLKAEPGIASGSAVILVTYLAVLTISALVWIVSPGVALTAFLFLSIVHFAREWSGRLPRAAAICAAVLVIAIPALAWPAEVDRLFVTLSDDATLSGHLTAFAGSMALPLAGLLGMMLVRRPAASEELPILLALGVAGLMLKPLHAFAIFFALVHSPQHLTETGLRHRWSASMMMWLALPLTAVTLVGFALLLWQTGWTQPAATTFLLLAILAVPHMFSAPLLRLLSLGSEKLSSGN